MRLILALLLALSGCTAIAERAAPATPQRPTFANDTNTTAAHTFELEAGVVVDPSDSFDSPITLKHGLAPRTDVSLGFSPLVYLARPGEDGNGNGDLVVGAKHRLLDQSEGWPAFGVEIATKLPTASEVEGIGSGEIDFFAALIATGTYGDVGLTGYYRFGALGAPGAAGVDGQHAGALAASLGVAERTSAFAEIAGIFDDERKQDSVFTTLGVEHALKPSLVLDGGIVVGVSDDAPDFGVVIGVTVNFGPLAAGARRSLH
jgi:hypothetical protein